MSGAHGPERVVTPNQLWSAAELANNLDTAVIAVLKVTPSVNEEKSVWLAHHQRAARAYRRIAEIDHVHRHEALAFARAEENRALRLATLPPQRTESTTP